MNQKKEKDCYFGVKEIVKLKTERKEEKGGLENQIVDFIVIFERILIHIYLLINTNFTNQFSSPENLFQTFWSVYSTHRNPKHFANPDVFDPSRFEGSGPAPFTFIPFGGGPKMCPGKEYARLEILVFMYNVVTRFKMHKLIPDEKIINLASPTPVNGLPVLLRRRNA